MAIGDTSIIKDANGVNITVKDIASDCLIEQADGTYHRENYRTDETMIQSGWIQSLGEKSYRKFPGGVILQWGWYDTNGATSTAVTLPIAFPNSVRAILTTASNSDLSFSDTSAVLVNNAKFNISTKSRSGWWVALGN